MFLTVPPAPGLASLVHAYWFVEDIPGEHEGQPIRTSPSPAAVLSVNIGRPNATDDGTLVPRASLLGPQPRSRSWRSWSDTYFVMVMLALSGLVRLFPDTGSASCGRLLDLGALVGDARAGALAREVTAAQAPERIAKALDRHLLGMLSTSDPVPAHGRLVAAHAVLRRGGAVAEAARAADVDRRQLGRLFHRHLGLGPKEVAVLERLQDSLRSIQTAEGDPVARFSDQSHQIRNWRRRLAVTPGAYRDGERSAMATYFSAAAPSTAPAFYL